MSCEINPVFYTSDATLYADDDDDDVTSSGFEDGESLGKRNLTYLTTNDEADGCITNTVLTIIRAVTGELLDRVIQQDLKDNCHGCAIDHPSQLQHACLFILKSTIYT